MKDTTTTTGASIAAKKKTPLPIAPAGIIKTASTAANNIETQKGSVSVKFDMGAEDKTQNKGNAKLLARKATPNFKALHKKQFENSKSIASLVDRVSPFAALHLLLLTHTLLGSLHREEDGCCLLSSAEWSILIDQSS